MSCRDINECLTNNGGCDQNAQCINIEGSFKCVCDGGFKGDGYSCVDIDECSNDPSLCENGQCLNYPGSYRCECEMGFMHPDDKNDRNDQSCIGKQMEIKLLENTIFCCIYKSFPCRYQRMPNVHELVRIRTMWKHIRNVPLRMQWWIQAWWFWWQLYRHRRMWKSTILPLWQMYQYPRQLQLRVSTELRASIGWKRLHR